MEANTFRIIVVNEPRAYREIIADSLRALRPHAEVVVVEPAALDSEVMRRRPHLVVCSRRSDTVLLHSPAWVLLYPDGESLAVVCIAGRETIIPNIEFADLLTVVDQARHLTQSS